MNPTTYKRRREHVCEECKEFRVWPDRLIYGGNFVVRITITLRTGKVKTEMLTESDLVTKFSERFLLAFVQDLFAHHFFILAGLSLRLHAYPYTCLHKYLIWYKYDIIKCLHKCLYTCLHREAIRMRP